MFTFKFVRVESGFSSVCGGETYCVEDDPLIERSRRVIVDPGRPDPARCEIIAIPGAAIRYADGWLTTSEILAMIASGDWPEGEPWTRKPFPDPRYFYDRCFVMNGQGKTIDIIEPAPIQA